MPRYPSKRLKNEDTITAPSKSVARDIKEKPKVAHSKSAELYTKWISTLTIEEIEKTLIEMCPQEIATNKCQGTISFHCAKRDNNVYRTVCHSCEETWKLLFSIVGWSTNPNYLALPGLIERTLW